MSDILNSLLDSTLEDLADMQKFEPLPVGSYRMGMKWEQPESDEFVDVKMTLENLEALEVPGVAEDALPAVGKKATFFMRLQRKDGEPILWKDGTPNTSGQGMFKEVLLALAPVFNPDGSLTNRQMMEASEGAEVLVTLRVRKNKEGDGFNVIKTIVLAGQ